MFKGKIAEAKGDDVFVTIERMIDRKEPDAITSINKHKRKKDKPHGLSFFIIFYCLLNQTLLSDDIKRVV
jgi:hypothetical protein